MTTKVYGASDDLIEFEGDVTGEADHYSDTDEALAICSDGTVLSLRYGKGGAGIWAITLVRKGHCFACIDLCDDEDAAVYSDMAYFREGLEWAYVARDWTGINLAGGRHNG